MVYALDDLLFPQYITPLNKRAFLDKVECPGLPPLTPVHLGVKCGVIEVSFAKESSTCLTRCYLSLTELLKLEQILRLVITLHNLSPLINH